MRFDATFSRQYEHLRMSRLSTIFGLGLAIINATTSTNALEGPEWAQQFYSQQFYQTFKAVPEESADLWVLLIIDCNATDAIKLGVRRDGQLMDEFFASMFRSPLGVSHTLHRKVITGSAVNEATILDAIAACKVRSNDALIVYYSGHGGCHRPYLDHLKRLPDSISRDKDAALFFATSSGPVFRWKIKKAMASKPAQLNILLTDCCANYESLEAGKSAIPRTTIHIDDKSTSAQPEQLVAKISPKDSLVRSLFFRTCGWVSIQACQVGQKTPGTESGGLFSRMLRYRFIDPSTIHSEWRAFGLKVPENPEWMDISDFMTKEAAVDDPSLPREKQRPDVHYDLDHPLVPPKGIRDKTSEQMGRSVACFAAGRTFEAIESEIAQAAKPQPSTNVSDLKGVCEIIVERGFAGHFDDGQTAVFQKGRNLTSTERLDESIPWCSISHTRVGLPNEKERIVLHQPEAFSSDNQGFVLLRQQGGKEISSVRLNMTARTTAMQRFVGNELVSNYDLSVSVGGSRTPTTKDLRDCVGPYLSLEILKEAAQ